MTPDAAGPHHHPLDGATVGSRQNAKPKRKRYQPPECESKAVFGRPWSCPDLKIVEMLARLGCTDEEIGGEVGVSVSWITERKHDTPDFLAALKRGRSTVKISLRRWQLERAEAGGDTMLVWLGKQLLGQRNVPEPPRPDEIVAESLHVGVDTGGGIKPIIIKPGSTRKDIRAAVDVAERPDEAASVAD